MHALDILHGPVPYTALVEASIAHTDDCPKRELTSTEKLCGVVPRVGACNCGAFTRADKFISRLLLGVSPKGLEPLLTEEFGLRKKEIAEVVKLISHLRSRHKTKNQKRKRRRGRRVIPEPNVLAALT